MIRDDAERHRFELEENGAIAFASYRRDDGVLVIPHVEAAYSLRGTGAAGRLMQGVMERVRAEGLKVRPLCGYARSWIQRHPEYRDLLA